MTHLETMFVIYGGLVTWVAFVLACAAHTFYHFKAAEQTWPHPTEPKWWVAPSASQAAPQPNTVVTDGHVKETV